MKKKAKADLSLNASLLQEFSKSNIFQPGLRNSPYHDSLVSSRLVMSN